MNQILQGHVLDVLKTIPDKSVDMIITSPPYWALRDYGAPPQIWDGDPECPHDWEDVKIKKRRGKVTGDWERPSRTVNAARDARTSKYCKTCGAWFGTLGLEPTIKMYIRHLTEIFIECKRVLADHGSLFVNIGDTYYGSGAGVKNTGKSGIPASAFIQTARPTQGGELPKTCLSAIPERLIIALIDDAGYIYRNRLVWHKPNPLPESVPNRFSNDHELLPFFVKKAKYYFKQQFEPAKSATIKRYQSKKLPKVGGDKYTDTPTEVLGSDRFSGQEIIPMMDRNMRCVWTIAPSYDKKRINFATYPRALITTPIDACCPKLVCNGCGKPIKPIITKVPVPDTKFYERKVTGYKWCNCVITDGPPFRKGVVLDIFIGTGTTALEAKSKGVDYLGIELMQESINYAEERLKEMKK